MITLEPLTDTPNEVCQLMQLSVDGQWIARGGIVVLWAGNGEVWIEVSDIAHRYRYSIYKAMLQQLKTWVRELHLHRMQAVVRETSPTGHLVMEHLDWTREGVLHQAAPDQEDMIMYAWLRSREQQGGDA